MGFSQCSFDRTQYVVQIEVERQGIEMTRDNSNNGKSVLYWITLGIIFAAFFMVAAS